MTFRSILLLILFGAIVITFIGELRQGVAEANLRVETMICRVLAVEAQLGAIRRTTQDFRFGLLATSDPTSNRLHWSRFSGFSIPSDSSGPGRGQLCSSGYVKAWKCLISSNFSDTSPSPSLLRPVWFPFAAGPYPAGTGRPSIRRTMLPNRRRVRWLSASINQ